MLRARGSAAVGAGRLLSATEYEPRAPGPGRLLLRFEDQQAHEAVEGELRLDPWIADEYEVIESAAPGAFFLLLRLLPSVALEYQEGESIDSPWHSERADRALLVVATERRVWCVDERGAIRWIWSCRTADDMRWIRARPVVVQDRVRVPLQTPSRAFSVDLRVDDGLPA